MQYSYFYYYDYTFSEEKIFPVRYFEIFKKSISKSIFMRKSGHTE